MRIDVEHPRFEHTGLQLDTGGIFGSPGLFLDGRELQPDDDGTYFVEDGQGEKASIRVKNTAFDPIPRLMIDSDEHTVVEPLRWFEWVWVGIPFILIPIGGCLGGGLGGMALVINATIFRTTDNTPLKWGATAGVSIAAFITFFVLAVALELAIR